VTFSTAVENACGNDRAGPLPTRSVHSGRPELNTNVERLRSQILAAARCADLERMHDAIVAYHQLLGIEEGERDPAAQALASGEGKNQGRRELVAAELDAARNKLLHQRRGDVPGAMSKSGRARMYRLPAFSRSGHHPALMAQRASRKGHVREAKQGSSTTCRSSTAL
jgi:hypothetical protein